MNLKSWFCLCLAYLIANLSQVNGQVLQTVKFDFGDHAPHKLPVKCDEQAKTKSCDCSVDGWEFLRGPATFTMTSFTSNKITWGSLVTPDPLGEGMTVSINCSDNHGPRTPNLTMIRGIIFDTPDVMKSYTFSNRPLFPDEIQTRSPQPKVNVGKGADRREPVANSLRESKGDVTTGNGSLNLHDNDKRLIQQDLQQSDGDTAQAAKKLGISERALLRKMNAYRLVKDTL